VLLGWWTELDEDEELDEYKELDELLEWT